MRLFPRALGAALLLLTLVVGCTGGIIKGLTHRTARDRHAKQQACPKNEVKTEVVQQLPTPEGMDYVALVRATGCGNSKVFKCWSGRDERGFSDYTCEDTPK